MLSRFTHSHAVFVFVLCLLFVPLAANNLWWRELFNSAHTIVFIYIFVFIYSFIKSRYSELNLYSINVLTLLLGVVLGGIVELAQFFIGREMSWQDLYRDACGLLAGLGLVMSGEQIKKGAAAKSLILPILIFVSGLILGVNSLLQLSSHYYQRARAFPVLLDFNSSWSDSFVRYNRAEIAEVSSEPLVTPGGLYRVIFKAGRYPGINIIETEADWSVYQFLSFVVLSTYTADIEMTLRVHDAVHDQEHDDRFNRRLSIHEGVNEIRVALDDIEKGPLNRKLDLSNVSGLVLFIAESDREVSFELSNLNLE